MSRVASAETYPSRPVRLLVGFAPGGGTDVMTRLAAALDDDGVEFADEIAEGGAVGAGH